MERRRKQNLLEKEREIKRYNEYIRLFLDDNDGGDVEMEEEVED